MEFYGKEEYNVQVPGFSHINNTSFFILVDLSSCDIFYFPRLPLFSFTCSPAFHKLIISVYLSICISMIICQFAVAMVGI